jgi:hypothetical protein
LLLIEEDLLSDDERSELVGEIDDELGLFLFYFYF